MAYNQFVGRGGKLSASSTKSELEIKLSKANDIPGPGAYEIVAATTSLPKGGRISSGSPKSDLEWKLLRAAKTPAPGLLLDKSLQD